MSEIYQGNLHAQHAHRYPTPGIPSVCNEQDHASAVSIFPGLCSCHCSNLETQQIQDHLPTSHPARIPQRRQVERAGEAISQTKRNHGRNPATRIFQRKAGRIHLVLLDGAAAEMMDGARRVDLRLERARRVGRLCALDDVEVVVSSMTASVTFGADGGA